ncbi:hypothetical protein [Halorientalis halophila]|uniref:hypothetical protein n=1 Tax=Halorientalis halophila TaxID=3108499 RepID=UPI0030088CF9
MARSEPDETTERERLVFGAGFAFGVVFTMSILAVVVATVVPRQIGPERLLSTAVWLPIAAAIALSAVAGIGLYQLALPDRGFDLPGRETVGDADDE